MASPTGRLLTNSFHAASETAAYYMVPSPGYLRIAGETRKDYLQRQTTNDLDLLSPTRALPAILPSPIGRILEVFTMLDEGEDIGLLTQPGHGPGLANYFQKHRFFNDQVTVADLSSVWMQIELHGPRAADALSRLTSEKAPSLDEVAIFYWQGHQLRAIAEQGFGVNLKFRLLVPAAAGGLLAEFLSDLPAMDLTTRRTLRVEAGQPGDPEFNGEYTPFEVALSRLVSAEKGCYTGQEVLARQVTYDKIVRGLVRIRAAEPLEPGSAAYIDGKAVGEVTSAAVSPRLGAIALAVLRRPHDEPGTLVELHMAKGNVQANVG